MDKHYEIDNAKQILRQHGYFVDNLWSIEDVQINYECDDETAMKILKEAMGYEATYEQIWSSIETAAEESFKLQNKDQ